VIFANKNFEQQHEQRYELQHEFKNELSAISTKLGLSRDQVGIKLEPSQHQVGTKSALSWHLVIIILDFCRNPQPIQNIMEIAEWKDRTKFRNKFINLFLELGLFK
jgi:hypothetical protein